MRRADSTPGGFRRVSSFFVAQGRRETEARQGFRAAGLRHKALEDEAWEERSPEPATNRPAQAGPLRASGAWAR